jgi:hypothetical protein
MGEISPQNDLQNRQSAHCALHGGYRSGKYMNLRLTQLYS